MTIVASAPGKLVVSGEYAVLVGAPALALAVDRRIACTLRDAPAGGWRFTSHGYAAAANHAIAELLADAPLPRDDAAHLCQHVLRQLRLARVAIDKLPHNLVVDIDSRAGFDAGHKLGLGTSAAVSAALTGALLELCSEPREIFPIAFAAHRAAQGGRGSGIDVAATCHGGLIRFETGAGLPRTTRLDFPAAVSFAAIWTGASADTRTHITHFDRWRAGGIPPALAALVGAAAAVVGALPDAREFMRQLRAYVITLQALDRAARLGIYSAAHRTLSDLAPAHGVIYKPCGAGGGDLGMAFAPEPAALATFERAAGAAGFNRLPLELDEHGITVGVKR